jgi:23S rRNA (uracil1939-C5)-methyltransferase
MNRRKKIPEAFETTIEKLVYGGAGLGRHQGKVVFVPFSVPGDRLLVRPVAEKKTYTRGEIVKIIKPGNGRITPICPHFSKCGGCHWQQLEYSRQVEAKRRILEEIFHHRFPQTRELPIVMKACAQPFAYRSRARVQLRGTGSRSSVGFFRFGSSRVEDIESCPLFRSGLNEALSSLRQYRRKVDQDDGPREMDMACSEEEDIWATEPTGSEKIEGITTLIGSGRRESVILRRKIGGFLYSLTASVFFQANDFMIQELLQLVREAAKISGSSSALDLFAGVGLFSLLLARQFQEVIAVESSPAASRLCSHNAKAAGFGHIQAVCADVSEWMNSMQSAILRTKHKFDLIVLDPPRSGAGPGVMKKIREWDPDTILYVSCDPQTLARDLSVISPRNYTMDLVEGLDMFPQTYHFETVVRLIRK